MIRRERKGNIMRRRSEEESSESEIEEKRAKEEEERRKEESRRDERRREERRNHEESRRRSEDRERRDSFTEKRHRHSEDYDRYGRRRRRSEESSPERSDRKEARGSVDAKENDFLPMAFDREDGDIDFDYRAIREERAKLLERSDLPKKDEIYKGVVVNVKDFGAFVRVDPFKFDGLVGTNEYIYDLPPPKCCIGGHRDRISYSIRRVSQKDGKDLNLPLHFDRHMKSEADAIRREMSAKCTRCGGLGHLACNCFVDLTKRDPTQDYLNTIPSSSSEDERAPSGPNSFLNYAPSSRVEPKESEAKEESSHHHIHKHKHRSHHHSHH